MIESLVGRGGMGVVYRAHELDLDRVVALKVIAPELVEDTAIRERFLNEARSAAAIEHPHVIPVHAAGEADGLAFLAMRFVQGRDLRARVRRSGALAVADAVNVIEQAAAGLDAIHSGGLVHRDIKPANLLIDASGHVYVTDFGLVKQALSNSGATSTGRWVGSLDYIAPEQIRGGRVDARADVYALGGVLYFALTAHVPFERDSDHAKLWAQLSEPAPKPSHVRPGVPIQLDTVVARAMRKSPDQRFPSAGDLARAANAALGGPLPAPERMVARGAAAPDGADTEPGIMPEEQTATALRDTALLAPERPKRRRWVVPAVAAVLAGAGVVTAVLLDDGAAPLQEEPGAAAVAGEPTPAVRVVDRIENVGDRPSALVYAQGALWVGSHRLPALRRVDPRTNEVTLGPRVGNDMTSMTTDGTRIWVAFGRAQRLVGIDARTGRIFRRVDVGAQPLTAKAGRGGLWVLTRPRKLGRQYLLRYDRQGDRTRTVPLRSRHAGLTLGAGSVWLGDETRHGVAELHPRTLKLRSFTRIAREISAMSYGGGYVWVVSKDEDSVTQIDPRPAKPTHSTVAAGHSPAQAVVAGGKLYVSSALDHTVLVFDADEPRPENTPVPVGLSPYGLATDDTSVWVTSRTDNTLTRITTG
jgi:DNA-binding beta-propeller fold protein YncE